MVCCKRRPKLICFRDRDLDRPPGCASTPLLYFLSGFAIFPRKGRERAQFSLIDARWVPLRVKPSNRPHNERRP